MNHSHTRVKVLRVRPLSLAIESESQGKSVWGLAAGHLDFDPSAVEFEVVQIVYALDPADEALEVEFRRVFRAATQTHGRLLVDLNIGAGQPRVTMVQSIVADVLWEIILPLEDIQSLKVSVLTAVEPFPQDDLAQVATADELHEVLDLVYLKNADNEVPFAVRNMYLKAFNERLVRKRGVFHASDGEKASAFYRFNYSADLTLHEFRELLRSYFIEKEIGCVVYEAWPSWFERSVQSVCASLRLPQYSREQLPDIDAEADIPGNVCFAVPARRTGHTLTSLVNAAPRAWRTGATFLSILLDATRLGDEDISHETGFYSARANVAHAATQVDFFARVELPTIPPWHWSVKASQILGEVQSPGDGDLEPGFVGLWDLFLRVGAGPETAVPAQRAGVSYYPALHDLDVADALWLAESLVARIQRFCGMRERENLLILIPSDENGADLIASQMAQQLSVAVARVDRDSLTGRLKTSTELEYYLDEFSDLAIVAVDESSVTYSSLVELREIVSASSGAKLEATATVLDLGPGGNNQPQISLLRWRPFRWLTGGNADE